MNYHPVSKLARDIIVPRAASAGESGASVTENGAVVRLRLKISTPGAFGESWALVDSVDFDRVSQMGAWHEMPDGRTSYAVQFHSSSGGHVTRTYLHRVVLGALPGSHVDHINGNGLDCRHANLRELTCAQNGQNRRGANRNSRSGIRGVRWHSRDERWEASLKLDGRVLSLGYYKELADAAAVVAEARRRLMPFSVEAPTLPVLLTPYEVEKIVSARISRAGVSASQ